MFGAEIFFDDTSFESVWSQCNTVTLIKMTYFKLLYTSTAHYDHRQMMVTLSTGVYTHNVMMATGSGGAPVLTATNVSKFFLGRILSISMKLCGVLCSYLPGLNWCLH